MRTTSQFSLRLGIVECVIPCQIVYRKLCHQRFFSSTCSLSHRKVFRPQNSARMNHVPTVMNVIYIAMVLQLYFYIIPDCAAVNCWLWANPKLFHVRNLIRNTQSMVDLKEAAELLGDSYEVVINTYFHTDSEKKVELIDSLDQTA